MLFILNYSGEDLFLKYIPQFEFYLGFISDKKQVEEKISQTVKQLTELSVFLSLFLFLVFLFFDFNRKKEERSLLQSFSNIFSENRVNFNRLTEVRDYTERYYNEVRRYIRNIVSGNHNLNIDKKFKTIRKAIFDFITKYTDYRRVGISPERTLHEVVLRERFPIIQRPLEIFTMLIINGQPLEHSFLVLSKYIKDYFSLASLYVLLYASHNVAGRVEALNEVRDFLQKVYDIEHERTIHLKVLSSIPLIGTVILVIVFYVLIFLSSSTLTVIGVKGYETLSVVIDIIFLLLVIIVISTLAIGKLSTGRTCSGAFY